MKTFDIWTEQINADHFTVEAENRDQAYLKARELWKQRNLSISLTIKERVIQQ